MADQKIVQELQQVAPSAIIELFELRLVAALHGSNDVYRFHAGVNAKNNGGSVVWAGQTYTRMPIECEGFEYSGNGQLPRPTLRIANVLGTVTTVLLAVNAITPGNDLIGAKVIRKRTLARYLDAVNFAARRNLLTSSSSFGGSWAYGATLGNFFTVTTSAILAPDGTQSATQFVATSITSQGLFLRASQSQAAGSYNISFYLYVPSQSGVTSWSIQYDAADSADVAAAAAQTVFNSWVRVSVPITYTATRAFLDFNIRRNGAAPSAAGFVFHAWGAQLELGTTATSYEPVGTAWSQNPYGTPDPTAEFPEEIYYISRKVAENRDMVEFEMAAVFDLQGVRGPKRQCIANICQWVYRSAECSYTGTAYFNDNDQAVGTLALDVCGKRVSSCKARFGITPNISTVGTTNTLAAGQDLLQGQQLVSTNGWYRSIMQSDGNFVVYSKAGTPIWFTATNGSGAVRLSMQVDGNLVLYNAGNAAVFSWNIFGSGHRLVMQSDGNLVVYNSSDVAVWSINYSSGAEPTRPSPALPFGSFPGIGSYTT